MWTTGPGDQMPLGFTPDGAVLIVNEKLQGSQRVEPDPPPRLTPLLHSKANEWIGEGSPDGNWMAYESDESGDQVETFVRRFADPTGRREKVSMNGGRYPVWARHGVGELFYVDFDGAIMAVSIMLSPTLVVGRMTKLFEVPKPPRTISARPYDVSPLDGRFLVARPVAGPANRDIDITILLNWFDELRRIVPTR